jgi:large subunit ribosomal protein L2
MALKTFKPVTPSSRELVLVDRSELWKGRPIKSLVEGKSSSGGRNAHGHITVRHKGGGHKKLYRIVDFKRRKFDVEGVVERLEYDPNRTAWLALVKYSDGEHAYILAPQRLAVGDKVMAGDRADIKPGNALPIRNIPVGTIIHNVELKPGKGGQLARSAGTYVQLVGKDQGFALLRLSSGETRRVMADCLATIGAVSNPDHANQHGGGEGRTKGGRHPVSPWGTPTKGYKTRKNKRTDHLIVRRRNAK